MTEIHLKTDLTPSQKSNKSFSNLKAENANKQLLRFRLTTLNKKSHRTSRRQNVVWSFRHCLDFIASGDAINASLRRVCETTFCKQKF